MSLAEQISDCLPEKQLIPIDEQVSFSPAKRLKHIVRMIHCLGGLEAYWRG